MSLIINKSYPRLWSIEAGRLMVVTDLHGDWDAYRRYRDQFFKLQAQDQADCLIFTGDLIHHDQPVPKDKSIEIILDLLKLKEKLGQALIYLCGNHEMPHIYHTTLAKGNREYTAPFERALTMTGQREAVYRLFEGLPFYIRTRAGISLTHAGAAANLSDPHQARQLFTWQHQTLLSEADQALTNQNWSALRRDQAKLYGRKSYNALVQEYFGVSDPDDSHYDDLLRGLLVSFNPLFKDLLWPALFTRCEDDYGLADYRIFLRAALHELSHDFTTQQFLVAGHMRVPDSYQVVAGQHLRLASGKHAVHRRAGQYLLFDAGHPLETMDGLLAGLGSVYR